jgi:hypothetical protein
MRTNSKRTFRFVQGWILNGSEAPNVLFCPTIGGIAYMALCKGHFSDETIQKIKANPDSVARQPCANCGTPVAARNYGGNWEPDSHSKPPKERQRKRP